MKKIVLAIIIFAAAMAAIGCGHVHQWSAEVIKAASCTEDGEVLWTCECGETCTEKVESEGHKFGEWEEISPASCTTIGRKKRVCSVCDEEEFDVIPSLKHDYIDEVVTPVTCEQDGVVKHTCRVCGDNYEEEIPSPGHEYGEWTETVAATCETAGEKQRTCKNCTHIDISEIKPLGHDYVDEIIKSPTCVEKGEKKQVCSRDSSHNKTVEIPELGHDWQSVEIIEPATCTTDGKQAAQCSRCLTFDAAQTIPALGHDWGAPEVIEPATCTHDGTKAAKCKRCKATGEAQTIPMFDHEYGEWKVATPASCELPGSQERTCKNCTHVDISEIKPLGHDYKTKQIIVAATCVSPGQEEQVCSRDSTHTRTVEVPALGHDVDTQNWVYDVQPTPSTTGEKSHHCKRCEYKTDVTTVDTVPATMEYSVSVTRVFGELPSGYAQIAILDKNDNQKDYFYSRSVTEVYDSDTYIARVILPYGNFSLEKDTFVQTKDFTLTVTQPSIHVIAYSALVDGEAPSGLVYQKGDAVYNEKLTIVGRKEADDYETSLIELMSTHKAILINFYFDTCSACKQELPGFVNAANSISSTGRAYKDEIAIIMLVRAGDPKSSVRNTIITSQYDLPFYMAYAPTLARRFVIGGYPTNVIIDCEGCLVFSDNYLYTSGFTNAMETHGIQRYAQVHGTSESTESGISLTEGGIGLTSFFDRSKCFVSNPIL